MKVFNLGWVPDRPDIRDRHYKELRPQNRLLKAIVRPAAVDLRGGNFPPIFDQLNVGSCVFNSLARTFAFTESVEGNGVEVLSRLAMYWYYRKAINMVNEDTGSTIRDGIKTVVKYGAPLEELWPYDQTKWKDRPSDDAIREGRHRQRSLSYYRLDTLSDMLDCIAQGYPISFGTMLYEPFMDVQASGGAVVPMPTRRDQPVGGHAMTIVGYDVPRKLFLVANSWGPTWGEAGYCRFPFAYLTNQNLADDFWTVRKIAR